MKLPYEACLGTKLLRREILVQLFLVRKGLLEDRMTFCAVMKVRKLENATAAVWFIIEGLVPMILLMNFRETFSYFRYY